MKRFISLRFTLCLFLLGMVCNVAWAQPEVGKYYKLKCKHDGSIVYANVTTSHRLTAISGSDTSVDEDYKIWYLENSSTQGKYTLRNKGTNMYVTPGDAWTTAEVVADFYIYVRTAGSPNYYNLSTSTTADLAYSERKSLHCWIGTPGKNWSGDGGGSQYEFVEVELPEAKNYTINIEGGAQNQTIKIGDQTISDGGTYTIEGTVNKSDITVVAPDGQFAAVSINDAESTINVYFATIPEQTTSETYQVPVLYPAQQSVVGEATSEVLNGVYTLSNNVLAASFAKMGGALYFAGSKAMDLLPGTEPFTVAFGNGDNVPASAMTLNNVALKNLAANANAIGGAEHYAGKALEANYTYTYNGSTITIVWRAVLRDGSHYLRTEMELTGVNDVDMFNIIPMIYNVDTRVAGSTPATIGNTRGAVIMSNKIFAGLETPTAYNTVGDATGEEDNYNLTTTMADVTLAANSWVQLTEAEAEAVKRVEEATGATYPNLLAYKQTGVALKAGQKVEVKVQYKTGNHRLNFGGADLIASNGDIAANDYHSGYSGGQSDKNTFTFIAPNDGTFTIRVFVENKSESIDATSTLTTKIYTPKEGVVINTDVVGIQGRWSRNTTLAAGETWKVGAVVGLIAQDGTQANADIHSTQKRRSFLAYSERERAVPWRATPCYISWYELNINRNNAAPGSEHTNMVADQVLDVLAHWKSDMYDRYGVGANMYIIDDGWDEYGEWNFHSGFPNQMRDIAAAAKELGGAGVGAWLGPVGGYGQSGTYRRNYWSDKGGMQLSNPRYYQAFKDAAYNLVKNQGDNYTFFKFDGISAQFSAVGPDAGDTGNENAEGIIRLERFVREELREDIFFNTTVGTWASPFWYQITDATWRQENDHGETGNNSNSRENWITYRDRLVYQNYVKNSPICPINTLMTHGFILTKFGPPASNPRDYNSVRNELRCAFLCGSGMVELYNDYDLMNSINGGALWADLAECIAWQKRNADVLPDAHWVGGNPWDGSNCNIYGWAAWNGTKSSLALRNGSNNEQSYTFTLRQVLNIPQTVTGSIILRSAFGDQGALSGLTEGEAYGIDESITVTLPGSSVYAFEGIASNATINKVSSIELTSENSATQVEIDNTLVLKAAVNADATFPALTWTSSNPEVATVSGGLVVPVKTGTTTITAEAKDGSGITATMTLTVIPDMDATVVTDLVQLSNEKVYTLRSTRAFLFYRPESNKLCSSTGTAVGSVTLDNKNPKHQFRIEKIGENYYLYSVGAEKYVAKDGTFVATPTDALTFTDVSASRANFPWQLALGGNGMNSQGSGQTAEGIVFNSYNTTDDGNCYTIEVGVPKSYVYTVHILGADGATVTYDETAYQHESTFETKAEFTESDFTPSTVDGKFSIVNIDGNDIYVSYFANDTQFYTIHGGHNGYLSLGDGYHSNGELLLTKTDVPKDNKALWTFVEQTGGGYRIYNYSTGLSKVLGMTGNGADARATMVAPDASMHATTFEGTFNFDGTASYIKSKGTNNWWNKRGNYLAYWNTGSVVGDTGSKFFFEEADYTEYPDEYVHEISNIQGIASYQPKNANTLWYKTSAEASGVSYPWMEYALPLGNGELGCMVFGGVAHEELQFNEKTLWSGPANTVGAGDGNRTFMNFGSLIIANNDASIYTDGVTDYVRYLDIEEGIAGVEFENSNGTKQIRKYLSSAPDQVIAGQYKSVGDDKLNLTFSLEPGQGINASEVTYEDNTASFSGKMTVEYAARLHVVAKGDGATVTATKSGIKVANATEVDFFLKGATNFNGDMTVLNNYFTADDAAAINSRVAEELETVAEKDFEAVETAHVANFKELTGRMTLDLGLTTPTVDTKTLIDNYYPNNTNGASTQNDHLFLEQLYFHYGRYLAISSNRKDIAAPNNLQGIWNDRGTNSPWNSDIHTNINIQMNYWPTEITNLSDLHKPFVNFIIRGAQSDGWKKVGETYNDGHGWSVLTETSLYNSMSTWGDNYLVANVWYTSHLWTHYRYTQDKDFLKKAFPVMWSAAEFWFHRLIEDRGFDNTKDEQEHVRNYHTPYKFEPDGTYVAPNEFSAEQHDNQTEDGTAHAQQMIYYLFTNIKEAIDILGGKEAVGLTAEDITKLDEYLAKTDQGLHTETYTGAWGATYNGVNTGDLLLREWKYTPFDISNDKGHRHMSHLMALFPMDQITPESPYFEPAVNSLKLRGDAATGWSMGWKVNLWARAQDGDHAHLIIKNALKHSTSYETNAGAGGIYYNLFDSHAPFQIDGNFGVCSGIAEMLMQSAHGYINILPALPAVWENTGTITGMKAIGNFTVDFNWKNGKAQKVTILSNAGAPLKVRCNRGATDIANAVISVNGNEVAAIVENGIATIPCEQGQTVVIDFTQEITPASFTQSWTASPIAPWSSDALGAKDYPENVTENVSGFSVHKAETAVTAPRGGEVAVEFVYSGGNHKLNILGVDLVNAEGEVVASDYHHGTTGGSHSNNTYTLTGVTAGDYTLRYFVGAGNGDALNQTNGNITVTGLALQEEAPSTLPVAGKYYRIGYDFGGNVGVKYMQSTNSSVKGLAMTDDKGEGSIFLVEEIEGNLRLKSISTGKYLKEDGGSRGLYDTGGNVTFTEGADGKIKIQAPSYLHANSSGSNYFIDHCGNDGCAAHNFIVEEVEIRQLTINGDSKIGASATWNGETKSLPATWAIFDGITISNPTLSVSSLETYQLDGLYEGNTSRGKTIDITSLDEDLTLTAQFTPAFFSSTYGEKWVRLQNCSGTNYWATMENVAASSNGKTATLDYADTKQLWCLVGTAEGFVLYNKAGGENLALKVTATTYANGSQATLENDTQAKWKLIEQEFGYAFVPTHNTNASNLGINMYGGNGGNLKLFGTAANNKGSYWVVEMADVAHPLTLNVVVDEVEPSCPRVAELTFTINGKSTQTRILGNVEGQELYIPAGATYEVSSMTYRGYTYNGCTDNDRVLTASYTANDERTLFYTPGANGKPYRIPAIATAPNGDVFAICDYRPCGADIGNGDVDIVCRISHDNGATWGEELVLADGDGGNTNRMETGYGDPAIVVDRESNKILVMMVAGRTVCGDSRWDASKIGVKDASAVNRAARIYGTLNESTGEWEWTQPEEVTDDIYTLFLDDSNNATVTSYFIGSGKICQSRVVKKGEYYRLYCALWTRDQGNRVIYSDDFGGTWNVLGTIDDRPASNGNEPKCEELPDGTVILSSRVGGGRYFNVFTFADDTYTTGTWGTVANSTTVHDGSSQGTNGEIYKVKAVRKSDNQICDVMLQSVPDGPGRTNVTVWYKEMDYTKAYTPAAFAADWTVGKRVSDTESAYSTMILQADGRIGFFFEEAPGGYCMVYIPYTLEDLTDGKYSLYTVNSSIGQYEIGTFYASEAMQIPAGVKAYVAQEKPVMNHDNVTGVITLNQLDGIIPAGTGAVLLGAPNTYEFIPSISYGTAVVGNMLVGYEADNTTSSIKNPVTLTEDSSYYILTVVDGNAGFYKKSYDFNVANNKAYLKVPASQANSIRLRFNNNDGTTDIIEVPTEVLKANGAIYDLYGRRVEKPIKGGVYIVNGKKVIF